jgi:hypothetical protein
MKPLVVAGAFLAYVSLARAETWTCTFTLTGNTYFMRFDVSPPDLVETAMVSGHRYRIVQNNAFGIIATRPIAEVRASETNPTVGANTVVIAKQTGEFWHATMIAGQSAEMPVKGKCLKSQ